MKIDRHIWTLRQGAYCAPFGPEGRWVYVGPIHKTLPFLGFGTDPVDAYNAYEQSRALYAEMMEKRRLEAAKRIPALLGKR